MNAMKDKLLILDIDETLIYASEMHLDFEPDFMIMPYYVYKRPHVDEFLIFCQEEFQVAIWTSGTEDYALAIINLLFPENYPLAFMFSRARCTCRYDHGTG